MSTGQKITAERRLLDNLSSLLTAGVKARIAESRNAVDRAVIMLRENEPRKVFAKGYAAVTDSDGNVIPRAADIRQGDEYRIRMYDGSFTARVTEVKQDN